MIEVILYSPSQEVGLAGGGSVTREELEMTLRTRGLRCRRHLGQISYGERMSHTLHPDDLAP